MASAQQKRPLETNENTKEQETKRIRNIVQHYTLKDCIPIPNNITIYHFLHCFKNLKNSFDNTILNFDTQLLQHNGNINYQKIINDKLVCKDINSIMGYIYYLFNDHLLTFIQMNMFYIYYTTEESSHYHKLIKLIYNIIGYLNIIYDVKETVDYSSLNKILNKHFTDIYSIIKYTKFHNLRNYHSYYHKDLRLKNTIFNIHFIIDSIHSIINYNLHSKCYFVHNLCLRKINYNFIDISKKIEENSITILKKVELSKFRSYINDNWLSKSKRFVKLFVNKKQKLTIEMIINDLKLNYIPKLSSNENNFIKKYINSLLQEGIEKNLPTIHLLINKVNSDVLSYIETFKLLKQKINRYNYNGNLDNLPIQYYFRGKMNMIRENNLSLHNEPITLSNLYDIFDKNLALHYNTKNGSVSNFAISYNYKKYNRIIPNFTEYFINQINNPYWSIKNNIYPNNALIKTLLCINNFNYFNYDLRKSLLPYLPVDLWFIIFSFLKLDKMCGDYKQHMIFD